MPNITKNKKKRDPDLETLKEHPAALVFRFSSQNKQPNMQISKKNRGKRSRVLEAALTCQEKWKPDGPCFVRHLPNELLIEILSRLPAKTIMACKFVCKSWLVVISEPRFIRLHHSRSASGILIQLRNSTNKHRDMRTNDIVKRLHFTQVENNAGNSDNLLMEKMTFTTKNTAPVASFNMVNSCNGLVCLYGTVCTDIPSFIVCNPLLKEYITVPFSYKYSGDFNGFGWSAQTDEYKLLRTFYNDGSNLQGEVYTIGSGVWRSIGNAPTDKVYLPFNSLLHGALHYAPVHSTDSPLIHSFNFDTEQFRALPPPSSDLFKLKSKAEAGRVSLGVWESCLTYCVCDKNATKFDLWVMKDYGVEESWTKALVIENLYPTEQFVLVYPCWIDWYEPVMFLGDEEILMVYNHRIIVSYNLKTKTFRKTKIIQTRCNFFRSVAYSPCFESLHSFFKGEEVKKMRG